MISLKVQTKNDKIGVVENGLKITEVETIQQTGSGQCCAKGLKVHNQGVVDLVDATPRIASAIVTTLVERGLWWIQPCRILN